MRDVATSVILAQSMRARKRLHAEIDPICTRAIQSSIRRSVAQPGSASDLGSEGRRFESYRSDQQHQGVTANRRHPFFHFRFAHSTLPSTGADLVGIRELRSKNVTSRAICHRLAICLSLPDLPLLRRICHGECTWHRARDARPDCRPLHRKMDAGSFTSARPARRRRKVPLYSRNISVRTK